MADYPLRIVTPERLLFSGPVSSLRAPGSEGSFGVLARHAPMVASLTAGPLSFVEEAGRRSLAVSGGFVEVSGEGVTVLAETAEYDSEIDVPRAEGARDRARQRLSSQVDIDADRARAALLRALTRLRVAGTNP
ncbi:MAG: F0F1 ATP synthase subunit epsilon [Gemmatimonadaceae bacterium]|nr:F0F1 ATP synthase subunit epsilon [Gemmatimonadaceae bacterium]